ncbi:MAG: helix-turn-helix domain-containing protein [Hespellia sp.]|nr:helix-turn-helix domain-containing protein [Hespellia sp.]
MNNNIFESVKRCNYLYGELNTEYHNASLKLGLSDSAMQILYTICNFGESCLITDICRLTGLSKQTVNSALRKLEGDDIIRLESVTPKSKRVCLTERGKTLSKKTALRLIEAENAVFASWTEDEVRQYIKLIERFLVMFKEKTEEF